MLRKAFLITGCEITLEKTIYTTPALFAGLMGTIWALI